MKTKNRWLIAASAVGIHVSIGSIYAYSAWKMPLENTFGWSSTKTSMAFSIAIFFLGLSAAFLGRFIEKKGEKRLRTPFCGDLPMYGIMRGLRELLR